MENRGAYCSKMAATDAGVHGVVPSSTATVRSCTSWPFSDRTCSALPNIRATRASEISACRCGASFSRGMTTVASCVNDATKDRSDDSISEMILA